MPFNPTSPIKIR
jgi:hypothetical protein